MTYAILICVKDGCINTERNEIMRKYKTPTGTRWRDERWAVNPECELCGKRREREEVALYAG